MRIQATLDCVRWINEIKKKKKKNKFWKLSSHNKQKSPALGALKKAGEVARICLNLKEAIHAGLPQCISLKDTRKIISTHQNNQRQI